MVDKIKGRLISLSDFLSDEDILKCVRLYHRLEPQEFVKRCKEQIIEPQMEEINKRLGQENNPEFLAYLVQYVIDLAGRQ